MPERETLQVRLAAIITAHLATWPAPAPAGAVVLAGDAVPAGELPPQRFPLASVTKLLTALTVLRAAADGVVDLGEPAGPPGSTLANLLSHSSGLAMEGSTILSAPGVRRIYSNAGIEVAAALLAERTGRPFVAELSSRVLGPLEMEETELTGSPAWGAHATITDLARLGSELLTGNVCGAHVIGQLSTVHLPGLPGVLPGYGKALDNSWGLGAEVRGIKSPHWTGTRNSGVTFGHFGSQGSFLWVDPKLGLACAGLAGVEWGPWAADAWPKLSDAIIGEVAGG